MTQCSNEFTEINKKRHGLNAVYFKGICTPNFVIIKVAGSGATKQQVVANCQFLIDAGFNVMALGMYQWDDNSIPSEIPFDYVANAITWIKKTWVRIQKLV